MARTSGVLLAVTGVAVIAGLVYLPIWLHRHDPPPPSLTKRPSDVTLAEIPDATLVGRHKGRKVWRIHARNIKVAADGHTTTLVGIDRGVLYRNEKPTARVSAGQAVYNDDTGVLVVSEGLTLSASGAIARTQRLEWREKTDSAICTGPVVITWQGGLARAGSLTMNTSMTRITGRGVSAAAQLEAPMFRKLTQQLGIGAAAASLASFLTAPAASQAQPVKYKEVRFTNADVWKWDQASDTSIYEGHVSAVQGDTTFSADRIVYRKGSNTATVTGRIIVENPKNRIEAETAEVDFNTKSATLRGTTLVRITMRPSAKPDPNSLSAKIKDPVLLTCRSVRYFYKEKRAVAEGPVTIIRKTQTVTADSGTYSGANDVATLTGNVHGKDEKNQTFEAPSAKMSLKEGAEWIEAPNVKATFYVKDEDEAATPPAPPR